MQVVSSDVSIMSVAEGRQSDTNTIVYQVTVNSFAASSQLEQAPFLYVFSPITGQNITVSKEPIQIIKQFVNCQIMTFTPVIYL